MGVIEAIYSSLWADNFLRVFGRIIKFFIIKYREIYTKNITNNKTIKKLFFISIRAAFLNIKNNAGGKIGIQGRTFAATNFGEEKYSENTAALIKAPKLFKRIPLNK